MPKGIFKRKSHTQETKIKMSLAKKGKSLIHNGQFKKGKIPWNRGLKNPYIITDQTKQKISLSKKGKKLTWINNYGFNNPKWIIDRSKLVKSEKKHLDTQYKYWMLTVKKRDNWKCRIADVNCDGRLEAHHILNWKEYPELRYDINNGITLCHAHHPRGREKEAKLSPYFQKLVAQGK